MVSWFAWGYPFIFRAPHNQKRESITVVRPTRVGLVLESVAIFMAFVWRIEDAPGWGRVLPAAVLGILAAVTSWN